MFVGLKCSGKPRSSASVENVVAGAGRLGHD